MNTIQITAIIVLVIYIAILLGMGYFKFHKK